MERLDKLLASQGILSRKDAKSMIKNGRVSVNGTIEKSADRKICGTDTVCLDGKEINLNKYIYVMLNKPQGYVSATSDSKEKTVTELLPASYRRKNIFPAGRLDKDTEGFLLLTDDGALAHNLLSPSKHVRKTYDVTIDIPLQAEMAEKFREGILLNDGLCKPASLLIQGTYQGTVTLTEGRYHQIKRMFGCFGAKVVALKRISFGNLELDPALAPGECRLLTEEELLRLTGRIN